MLPYTTPPVFRVELEKDGWELVDMLWCQGSQNIGLANRKLKSAPKMHRVITMHARPRRTDGRTDRQTDRRRNIMAIARRFVLTNASRAKNVYLLTYLSMLYRIR